MTDNSNLWYILGAIIGLVVFVVLLRWLFSIDRHLKNQKAMIAFMIKLCRQQDVPETEIDELKQKFEL